MDNSTLLSQLTADIIAKINDLQDNSELLQMAKQLSAVPAHPYDQVKYQYLGTDYKFPTINDIEVPETFDPITITAQLTSIAQYHTKLATDSATTLHAQMTAAALSEDNLDNFNSVLFNEVIHTDPEVIKKSVIFTELVKSVSMDDVKHRPRETLQKLLTYYTNLHLT